MSQQFTLTFVYRRTLQRDQVIKHDRGNWPHLGHIVCRLKKNGHRSIVNHGDIATLEYLASCIEGMTRPRGFLWLSFSVTRQ